MAEVEVAVAFDHVHDVARATKLAALLFGHERTGADGLERECDDLAAPRMTQLVPKVREIQGDQ